MFLNSPPDRIAKTRLVSLCQYLWGVSCRVITTFRRVWIYAGVNSKAVGTCHGVVKLKCFSFDGCLTLRRNHLFLFRLCTACYLFSLGCVCRLSIISIDASTVCGVSCKFLTVSSDMGVRRGCTSKALTKKCRGCLNRLFGNCDEPELHNAFMAQARCHFNSLLLRH